MTGRPRLTVFGTGYLGTAHAACLASLGFEVLGVDVDAWRNCGWDYRAPGRPSHPPGVPEGRRHAGRIVRYQRIG